MEVVASAHRPNVDFPENVVADLRKPYDVDRTIGVIREAAANHGNVTDATWDNAVGHGWTDGQLAEAFGYLGLTVFTSYFLNYAATELDVPAGPARAGEAGAGAAAPAGTVPA